MNPGLKKEIPSNKPVSPDASSFALSPPLDPQVSHYPLDSRTHPHSQSLSSACQVPADYKRAPDMKWPVGFKNHFELNLQRMTVFSAWL